MLSSMVDQKRCAGVKKRVYMSEVDEFQHSSAPLSGVVLNTVMNSIPYSRPLRPLKEGYVNDLTRDGGISPCAMMLGLLYIKRLSSSSPAYLTSVTPRELFLIAMVVASKYMNDEGEMEALTNSDWAKIGSLTKTALDEQEKMFLEAIDWRLYVSLGEYYDFVTSIEGQVALAEASRRGWFTYTDMTAIWDASDMQTLMMTASKQTAKVVCGGAAIYLMCVATLLTASPSTPSPSSPLTPSHTSLQLNSTSSYDLGVPMTHPLSDASEKFLSLDLLLQAGELSKPPDIIGGFVGGAFCGDNCTSNKGGGVCDDVPAVMVGGCDGVWMPLKKSCDRNRTTPTLRLCDYCGVATPTGQSHDHVVTATASDSTKYSAQCQQEIGNKNRHQGSYIDSKTGLTSFKNKCYENEDNSNRRSMMSSLLNRHGNAISSPKVDSSFDLNFHLRGTFHWPPVNRTLVTNSNWNPRNNYTITESVLLYTQSLLAY